MATRPDFWTVIAALGVILALATLLLWLAIRLVSTFFARRRRHREAAAQRARALVAQGGALHAGRFAVISGRVRRLRAVSYSLAHVELEGRRELFELIAPGWAISRGDRLEMAVLESREGRLEALAHRNHDNGVAGTAPAPAMIWLLWLLAAVFLQTVVIPLLLAAYAISLSWRSRDIREAATAIGLGG